MLFTSSDWIGGYCGGHCRGYIIILIQSSSILNWFSRPMTYSIVTFNLFAQTTQRNTIANQVYMPAGRWFAHRYRCTNCLNEQMTDRSMAFFEVSCAPFFLLFLLLCSTNGLFISVCVSIAGNGPDEYTSRWPSIRAPMWGSLLCVCAHCIPFYAVDVIFWNQWAMLGWKPLTTKNKLSNPFAICARWAHCGEQESNWHVAKKKSYFIFVHIWSWYTNMLKKKKKIYIYAMRLGSWRRKPFYQIANDNKKVVWLVGSQSS